MKKILFVIAIILTLAACKTYNPIIPSSNGILAIDDTYRRCTITNNDPKNPKVFYDDIIKGDVIIINMLHSDPDTIITRLNTEYRGGGAYKAKNILKIPMERSEYETYIMWFDYKGEVHYRIINVDEIVHTNVIDKKKFI